jgi:hypothetical protein
MNAAAAPKPAMPPAAKPAAPKAAKPAEEAAKPKEGMYNYSRISFTLIVLFFILSPGVLLTIPAGARGLFGSGQTSVAAALVHAFVFVFVLKMINPYFYY